MIKVITRKRTSDFFFVFLILSVLSITFFFSSSLLAKENCELIEKKCLESGNRVIDGMTVHRDCWRYDLIYDCSDDERLSEDGCVTLRKNGCAQIRSTCLEENKAKKCISKEQTYKCAQGNIRLNEIEEITPSDYLKGALSDDSSEYSGKEFSQTLLKFQVLKEMNEELKDGLGGINTVDPSNPKVFQGKCQRCSIRGRDWIQNCCDLEGILQGMLAGGCNDREKELANAALKDKRCHLVRRRYCVKTIKYGVGKTCVSWKDAYCCYGSQLAKIIQEIAHDDPEQHRLRAHNQVNGIEQGWGSGRNPNCGSLTAIQLSLMDFDTSYARNHLAQMMKEFEEKAKQKLEMMQSKNMSDEGMQAQAQKAQSNMRAHQLQAEDQMSKQQLRMEGRPTSRFRETMNSN